MAASASGVYICFSLSCAETKYPAAGAVIGVYAGGIRRVAPRRQVRMRALKSIRPHRELHLFSQAGGSPRIDNPV
jgi:hypothetical protein